MLDLSQIVITIVLVFCYGIWATWRSRNFQLKRPLVICRAFRSGEDQPLSVDMSKKDVKRLRDGSPIRIPLDDEGLPGTGNVIIIHKNGLRESPLINQQQLNNLDQNPRLFVVSDEWLKTLPQNVDMDGVQITLRRAA